MLDTYKQVFRMATNKVFHMVWNKNQESHKVFHMMLAYHTVFHMASDSFLLALGKNTPELYILQLV